MRALAIGILAASFFAGAAAADDMRGDHGPGRNGWAQNSGVLVDVPWSAIDNGNNSGIPPRSNYENHCRDVRHSCFDQFGVSEPGYGQCMASRGC
jgi:hypothetical protein